MTDACAMPGTATASTPAVSTDACSIGAATASSTDACSVKAPAAPVTTLPVRPMGGNQARTHWRSEKRQRTLSLTHEAWDIFGELAMESENNRSEVLEILVRYAKEQQLNLVDIRWQMITAQNEE